MRPQARFRHLFEPDNRWLIDEIQRRVDEDWEKLLERCGTDAATLPRPGATGGTISAASARNPGRSELSPASGG